MRRIVIGIVSAIMVFGVYTVNAETFNCMEGRGEDNREFCHDSIHHHGEMGDAKHSRDDMWRHIASKLGLSSEQMEKANNLRSQMLKETARKEADIRIAEIEMKSLLDKEKVDLPAMEANIKQIESLRGDIKIAHLKMMEEFKSVLTPDQKMKLKVEKDKHISRMRRC